MKGVHYITFSDLSKDIRNNLWKIPHDIDFVICIPRAGTVCGSMIAEHLNVPLIDIDSFINGIEPSGGVRLTLRNNIKEKERQKALVVDDCVFWGNAVKQAKDKLNPFNEKYDFVFCAIYLEGHNPDVADIYLEDVSHYSPKGIQVIYEWNVFNHLPYIMENTMFDLDGVFCVEPPDDINEKEYLEYIKNAIPLFIPRVKIGRIVTYRISKNMSITEEWLKNNGISYNQLIMFKADSREERNNSGISPELMKASIYKADPNAILFIESDDYQAKRIHEISGKQVLCISTNKLYQ